MAEIQIVYRYYFCEYPWCEDDFNIFCLTSSARDTTCREFSDGGIEYTEDGVKIIPNGDCIHAKWEYRYKGWVGKRYEIEEYKDTYDPYLSCMRVKLGNKEYDCVKVILNGECIFNNEAEMKEHECEKGGPPGKQYKIYETKTRVKKG